MHKETTIMPCNIGKNIAELSDWLDEFAKQLDRYPAPTQIEQIKGDKLMLPKKQSSINSMADKLNCVML